MGKIITQCPSCSTTALQVIKIECENCLTIFEGKFDIPSLLKLSSVELQFILDFVKCSGSLKEMAVKQGISYPTLRNRLNDLISKVETLEITRHSAKEEILKLLENGDISAKEAAKLLHKI